MSQPLLVRLSASLLLAAAFLATTPAQAQAGDTEERETIESRLVPLVNFAGEEDARKSIAERQAELLVPQASVAIYRDGTLAWAQGYGDGTDPDTLFQFASLSKPVAALGILLLAQERGVDIDADISGALVGLDLARLNPESRPITLRGLLSHTAGATVGGFPGYDSSGPVPTTAQVIEGTGPANTDPVVIALPQGERSYSGGGFTIAQYWAEQVGGEPFAALMRRLVLDPLGMARSTFASAAPESFDRDNVARGWGRGGVPLDGGWRIHPEQAAASLWTNPREYGLFVVALMASLDGEGPFYRTLGETMTTPVANGYGLGIGVAEVDGAIRLSHSGSNRGYLSNFMAYPDRGDAVITVVNADSGFPLVGDIGRTANAAYGWPSSPPIERTRLAASADELTPLAGVYVEEGESERAFTLSIDGSQLLGIAPSGFRFRLVKTGEATFIDPADGVEGTFVADADGLYSVDFQGTTYRQTGAVAVEPQAD